HRHPPATLFPYTTLFRSHLGGAAARGGADAAARVDVDGDLDGEADGGEEAARHPALLRDAAAETAELGVDRRGGDRLAGGARRLDRKSTRLNSSHVKTSY